MPWRQCRTISQNMNSMQEPRMESEHSQFQLLRERRFAPFFWTQFLGAGNDNIYKNALVIFVAFQAATLTGAVSRFRATSRSTMPL